MAKKEGLSKDRHVIAEHRIKTADGVYKLYVQEWGNKDGVPVVYLHGGPGAGCHDGHKNVFDPTKHRVIFIDQRGAGRTTPYGSLKDNTTPKLIDDIEQVRTKLGIDQWHVHGTSWGSTLSLCYGINYPDKVHSIITGGIWLVTKEELDWLFKGGYGVFFPEAWEKYQELKKHKKYSEAYAYSTAFMHIHRLDDRPSPVPEEDFDERPLAIEFHYSQNGMFMDDDYILKNAKKLTMPVHIVQGRYDAVCPPKFAYQLHNKLPNSSLYWTIAGHSQSDRANFDSLKMLLSNIS